MMDGSRDGWMLCDEAREKETFLSEQQQQQQQQQRRTVYKQNKDPKRPSVRGVRRQQDERNEDTKSSPGTPRIRHRG